LQDAQKCPEDESPLYRTKNDLKRIIRKIKYFHMKVKQQTHIERKLDARKKIMLGGLFVKAGLDHFHPHDPATLYGILLHAKKLMDTKPELITKWRELGKELMVK
jgi:hypothetical protein